MLDKIGNKITLQIASLKSHLIVKTTARIFIIWVLLGFINFFGISLYAAPLSQLTEKVFELRAQIEKLGQETEFLRKNSDAEVEPLLTKKSEIIAQIEKEKLRKIQLEEKTRVVSLQKTNFSTNNFKKESELLSLWINDLRNYINTHVPYRSTQRLQTLADLEQNLQTKNLSHLQILDELVKISESELKLVQSKEFRVMPIIVNGKQVSAEVVRLGMMQMVFALPDNDLGYYDYEKNSKWEAVLVSSAEEKKQAQRLISHFKEKNTKGWFMVPVTKSNADEVVR